MRQVKVKEGMTQNEIIMKHMKLNPKAGISPMEAFNLYAITRLGGRIFELRKAGHDIKTTQETTKVGKTVKNFARYTLAS